MKKLIIALSAIAISMPALASDLPFVGKRKFSFDSAKDTETITIAKNGQTKITTSKTHWLGAHKVIYQGKYQAHIPVKLGDNTSYYQIKNGKVYLLDENKQNFEDCGSFDEFGQCSAKLIR